MAESYPYLNGKTNWVVKNEDSYFKAGLTFSFVSRNRLSVRTLPAGAIFDVGGSAIFARNEGDDPYLMAYLNSSLASALACDLNPTINFQVGDLKRIPQGTTAKGKEKLTALSHDCVSLVRELELFQLSAATAISHINSGTGNEGHICQEDWQRQCAIFEERSARLETLEALVDEVVLNEFAEANKLSTAETNELREWTAVSAEPPSRIAPLTRVGYARFNMITRILKHCLAAPLPLTAIGDGSLFSDGEKAFLELCFGENLERFTMSKLNKILLEEFAGQPPLMVTQGKLVATLRLLKEEAYAAQCGVRNSGSIKRARDLFN